MQVKKIFCVLFVINYTVISGQSDPQGNYFLQAAKNVPRIGRSNSKSTSLDEMGKFFMKASKSVPRIGRRNGQPEDLHEYKNMPMMDMPNNKLMEKRVHQTNWADLADRFEYEPELFSSPDFLARLEEELTNEGIEWDKGRYKRNTFAPIASNYRQM